jgi:hypothetical protein
VFSRVADVAEVRSRSAPRAKISSDHVIMARPSLPASKIRDLIYPRYGGAKSCLQQRVFVYSLMVDGGALRALLAGHEKNLWGVGITGRVRLGVPPRK